MLLNILLAASYAVNLVALLVRDILWLRSILMGAQFLMIGYAVATQQYIMIGANCLFFTINTVQVIRLLLERRKIKLPVELQEIYDHIFALMKMREFLQFWSSGKATELTEGEYLCANGETPEELMLIIDGQASVRQAGQEIVRIGRGDFVAEMSFMTGEAASADVVALNSLTYIGWNQAELARLKSTKPDLMIKIQIILGIDLTNKLKTNNSLQATG